MSLPHDLENALWNAQPYDLPATAETVVGELTGADSEILLPDYRQARLVPALSDTDPVPIDNSAQGRAYAAQEVVQEDPQHGGGALHLPLSVYGDRLGVLSVRPAGRHLDAGPGSALNATARVLARAMKVADGGTDVFRRIRRRSRLTLAAEMMWDLLPGQSCGTAEFHLAGQLEPAYRVCGDNFDWAVDTDRLVLTVSNGTGVGTHAAALTQLAVGALRNARRSGAGIAEQAMLADETIYAHHRGTRHVATLLLDYTPGTGRVQVVDAGSPNIFRMRDGATETIGFEAQLPLGMFGDTRYVAEDFRIERGDRLVIVSDGVSEATPPSAEPYGVGALARALKDTRLQDPPAAVRTLIRDFLAYHRGAEPQDDAVIVCLDRIGSG